MEVMSNSERTFPREKFPQLRLMFLSDTTDCGSITTLPQHSVVLGRNSHRIRHLFTPCWAPRRSCPQAIHKNRGIVMIKLKSNRRTASRVNVAESARRPQEGLKFA